MGFLDATLHIDVVMQVLPTGYIFGLSNAVVTPLFS